MPIKVSDFLGERSAFPRFGKLKKGGAKTPSGAGKDLEWFRFDGQPDKAAIFRGMYGEKPNNIRIFLPYATWQENFDVVYEKHGATGLQWRGDGEFLSGWRTKEGQWVRGETQPPRKQPDDPEAFMIGKLSFIIPELGFGYVLLETKSKHDILEIAANLKSYEALRGSGGLTGVPFVLCRGPRKITVPNPKSRTGTSQVVMSLVHIEIENDWVQAKLQEQRRAALPKFEVYDGDTVDDDDDDLPQLPAPKSQPIPNNGDPAMDTDDWDDPRMDYDDDEYEEVTHVTPVAPKQAPVQAKPQFTVTMVADEIKRVFGANWAAAGKHMVERIAPGAQLKTLKPDDLESLYTWVRNISTARQLARAAFGADWEESYNVLIQSAEDVDADYMLSFDALSDVLVQLNEDADPRVITGEVEP